MPNYSAADTISNNLDGVAEIRTGITSLDEARYASRMPGISKLKDPTAGDIYSSGRSFLSSIARRVEPPFDLVSIGNAYHIDSYIRQSVDKYVNLIEKSGWRLKSDNKKAVEYLKKRLMAISVATDKPTEQFYREIAEDIVLYANAFVVKKRSNRDSPVPGLRLRGVNGVKPIAGLFLMSPPTVRIIKDQKSGAIEKYEQQVGGLNKKSFIAADVIHLYCNKPRGGSYGIPHLVPVLEDVRILRQIEANIVMLLYRHLHPFLHVRMGVAAGSGPPMAVSQPEIDEMVSNIAKMAPDGVMVTQSDTQISLIGSESKALRADPYLEQFKERVLAGLGVPETLMGRSSYSTRSSADQLAAEMHGTAKGWQRLIGRLVSFHIFMELLYESDFDPINKEEDFVHLEAGEIDSDTKIKEENHAIQLYVQNGITREELRVTLNKSPLTPKQKQDFYVDNVTIPAVMARVGAVANAGEETGDEPLPPPVAAGVPSKQPKKEILIGELQSILESAKKKLILALEESDDLEDLSELDSFYSDLRISLRSAISVEKIKDFIADGAAVANSTEVEVDPQPIENKVEESITLFLEKLQNILSQSLEDIDPDDVIITIDSVFSSLKGFLEVSADTIYKLCYNTGCREAMKEDLIAQT